LMRSSQAVDAFDPESHQLNPETHQSKNAACLCPPSGDADASGRDAQVDAIDAFFSMPELAKLAGVSVQAVHNAIRGKGKKKPLKAQKVIDNSGPNKNRSSYRILHTDAFDY